MIGLVVQHGGEVLADTATRTDQRPRLGASDAVIDEKMALAALPRRGFGAHKWGVGGLLIVAGAPGFAGAATLCAMAANRAGAGIVNVALPRGIANVVVANVPEAAVIPLPDTDAPGAARRAVELIGKKLDKSTAIVVGPGLGEDEATDALLGALFGLGAAGRSGRVGFGLDSPAASQKANGVALVPAAEKPVVIDADGLNWLAKQETWWEALPPGRSVLTPHVGEMSRLLGVDAEEIVTDPVGTVRAAARSWRQVVVLKYGYTAVSDGTRTLVADDAPVSLASAGTGDILAGVIGAFLAQGVAPLDAAALAIHVGMRAARRVERTMGTLGLVATDLPPAIARELAALEAGEEAGRE